MHKILLPFTKKAVRLADTCDDIAHRVDNIKAMVGSMFVKRRKKRRQSRHIDKSCLQERIAPLIREMEPAD
ncbi:MAG: hypothetical protein WCL29_03510 [Pseudomonadota bacterium]